MIRRIKRKGSALIEMALLMPLFLLLIDGCIEYSLMLYDQFVITSASREGARYGTVLRNPTYATASQVISYTQTYCSSKMITFSSSPGSVTVTATPSSSSPKFGDRLTVTVSYVYTNLLLSNFTGISKQTTLTATTVMAYE